MEPLDLLRDVIDKLSAYLDAHNATLNNRRHAGQTKAESGNVLIDDVQCGKIGVSNHVQETPNESDRPSLRVPKM